MDQDYFSDVPLLWEIFFHWTRPKTGKLNWRPSLIHTDQRGTSKQNLPETGFSCLNRKLIESSHFVRWQNVACQPPFNMLIMQIFKSNAGEGHLNKKNRWIMNIERKEAAVTAFSRELARWYDFDYKLISLKLYFPSSAPSLGQHFPSASFFFVHCVPKLAKRKLLQIFRLLHRLCNQWCRKSTDVDPDIIFTTKVYYSHNKKRSWLEIQSAIGFKRLEVTKSRETLNSGCQ